MGRKISQLIVGFIALISLLSLSSEGHAGPSAKPVFLSTQELCVSSQPVTVYGASGASSQTVATCSIPAGTIQPGSVIEIDAHFNFPLPDHAGRTVTLKLGSQTIGQSFPTATFGSLEAKQTLYVAADAQSVSVQSANLNNLLIPTTSACTPNSPACTFGAPYGAQTGVTTSISVDLTQAQNLTIALLPTNDDIATLTGFSVTMHALPLTVQNYAPSGALAVFADSLGAGTGSLGSFILHTTGNTTSGSQTIASVGSTSGVLPGQVITGACIPTGTIVTATSPFTISQNASATTTGCNLTILAGAWPQQMLYASPGRPVYNNSVGGTTSAQISARQALDKVAGRSWILALADVCRNDVGSAGLTTTCQTNIAAIIGRLKAPQRWNWSTIIPSANEYPGSSNWNSIVATNTATSALYPSNTVDTFGTLTTSGTTNIPLKYRNAVNTTGTCTSGSNSLTVTSATNLVTGMYVITPGSTAIDNGATGPSGSTYTAPTVSGISGTTITLSANCSASISGVMVSFIGATEVHLNDLGYWIGYTSPELSWLATNGY